MNEPERPPYRTIDRSIIGTLEQNNLNGTIDLTSPACRELLASSLPNEKSASIDEVYETKLKNRPYLLDNPPKISDIEKKHAKKRNRKRDFIAGRADRMKDLFDVANAKLQWADFMSLNKLWHGYMDEVMSLDKNNSPNSTMQRLLKADFHGAIFTITKSKCPSYVGLSGIVIQETENVFVLITQLNKTKVIPKLNNIFTFELKDSKFTIYGTHFRFRSSERVSKKWKNRDSIDL